MCPPVPSFLSSAPIVCPVCAHCDKALHLPAVSWRTGYHFTLFLPEPVSWEVVLLSLARERGGRPEPPLSWLLAVWTRAAGTSVFCTEFALKALPSVITRLPMMPLLFD